MTVLVWDQPGERVFQTGVDRGVLYFLDGTVAAWNGLIGIEEVPETELKSFYLDGRKYLENLLPGDFSGRLRAFTYPDVFDLVTGLIKPANGLAYHNQPAKSFNLSYRTRIGNDLEGMDHGYKLHLLYNLIANPEAHSSDTLSDSTEATEFSWTLTGTPVRISGSRPTTHISVDSRSADPALLQELEDILYGTGSSSPDFPTIAELIALFVPGEG